MRLEGKTVAVGVTGGIAAYKSAALVSDLVKSGANVIVIMTRSAAEFIGAVTFETLSGNRVITDMFDRAFEWNVKHVSIAKKSDVIAVVPATANFIGKMAHGIADDMLLSTVLAARCPKIVAPAMNDGMYENPATQANVSLLRERGAIIVEPETGRLACGDEGRGRLAGLDLIYDAIAYELYEKRDMCGLNVLVTAGPTCERLDPVRYITNHSSGKMGYALAKAARLRGARVTLVSGPTSLGKPVGVDLAGVFSAGDMMKEVMERAGQCDIIIKAAAVGDFRPAVVSPEKIKKTDGCVTLSLAQTDDILAAVCRYKRKDQIVCGFSMETRDLAGKSLKKLISKNADMIVANDITDKGAGFGVDTNIATLLTRDKAESLPCMSKEALSHIILDRLLVMYAGKKE